MKRSAALWTIAAILSGAPMAAAQGTSSTATPPQNRQQGHAAREQIKQDREKLEADRKAGNKEAVKQDVEKLKADRQALRQARQAREANTTPKTN
jgi:hypothetical protein